MNNLNFERPLLVDVSTAGKLLSVSKHTIRSWHYSGKLEGRKLGSRLLIPFSEVERIANEGIAEEGRCA